VLRLLLEARIAQVAANLMGVWGVSRRVIDGVAKYGHALYGIKSRSFDQRGEISKHLMAG